MRRYLRRLLELESYQVEIAGNGYAALELIQNGLEPDVVLLDVQMPLMDGIETLQQLRTLRPEVKVIMCSGTTDAATMHCATALGAEAYLIKPVQHLYLSAAVESCLKDSADPGDYSPDAVLSFPPPAVTTS